MGDAIFRVSPLEFSKDLWKEQRIKQQVELNGERLTVRSIDSAVSVVSLRALLKGLPHADPSFDHNQKVFPVNHQLAKGLLALVDDYRERVDRELSDMAEEIMSDICES